MPQVSLLRLESAWGTFKEGAIEISTETITIFSPESTELFVFPIDAINIIDVGYLKANGPVPYCFRVPFEASSYFES